MAGLGQWLNNWYVVWEILECNAYGRAYRLDPKRTASSYCHSASKIKYQGNSFLFPTKPFFGFIKPSQVLITDHFIHEAGYEWFACQHSCSVVVSFPVEEDTNQGSNPGGGKKKNPLAGNPKNNGRAPACGTCGWFGPSSHVAVVANANLVGRRRPRLGCSPIGVKPGFRGFLGRFGWGFSLVQSRGGGLSPTGRVF